MKVVQGFWGAARVASFAVTVVAGTGFVAAHADTLTYVGPQLTQVEALKFGNLDKSVNGGAFTVSDSLNSFWVYCLDPLEVFNNASNTTSTMSLYTYLNGGQYDAQFTGTAYATAVAGGYNAQSNKATVLSKLVNLYSHAYNDSLTSTSKSAAFQYAVWETLGDSDYSSAKTNTTGLRLGSGNNDTVYQTNVNNYLSAISGGVTTWATLGLNAVSNFTYTVYTSNPGAASQNLLRVASSTTTNTGGQVPEPASLALVMAALTGLAYTRRNKVAAA